MRRGSRKNKSSWRKNVDVSDVEQFLREQREDESMGDGATLDSELFVMDDLRRNHNLKLSRKEKFQASPKFCLSLRSAHHVAEPEAKLNIRKLVPSSKRPKVTQKIKESTKTHATDIWENNIAIEDAPKLLNNAIMQHKGASTGKQRLSIKQTAVCNVEVPEAGASYNPALDDYNELKMSVVKKEREVNKHKEHYDRVITNKFTKMSKQDRDNMIWNEMAEGLLENEDNKDNEYDEDYNAINPAVANKKKDRKAKNKIRRAIHKRNADAIIKAELKKCTDIERITTFTSDLDNREAKIMKKQENRAKRLKEKLLKPPRVSYLKFEESEADFAEPTELTGTLRKIAPNKSLIVDRFKSYQKRALIAPKKHRDGILRGNKSYKKCWKRYTKSGHKDNNSIEIK
ncbi:ribosome biogenesis protein NOP53-like [Sabethes cyaneus]|uniref:ribosome biogenesis protein NOP53-like n=1 Tax=Sabethes cyaneus TaxID=53552 RepID=UPI00237E9450|nr:ribosome biogenesis protein NOP53-like [Sabethes cyaneus]